MKRKTLLILLFIFSGFFVNAQNQANINLDLKSDQQVSLKIIDLSGKVILSKNYGRLNGTYDLPIGLNGIESGVYFVNLLIGDQAITQKLIVE